MTPQSSFMVVAPIAPGSMAALKVVLAGMNLSDYPGMADPKNQCIPFGEFTKLHYARFVILNDQTLADFERIGEPVPDYPVTLAFLGDCDGPADAFLADMVRQAGPGLRQVFSYCAGFTASTDLLLWMQQHSVPAAAAYVNHIGRTVAQIHQEAKLRKKLVKFLRDNPPTGDDPQGTREKLKAHARKKGLIPAADERESIACRVRNFLHAIALPAAIGLVIVLIALFLVAVLGALVIVLWSAAGGACAFILRLLAFAFLAAVLIFLVALRAYEKAEPEIVIRPTDGHAKELGALEDYDAVNQFSVIGSVKPSAFRRRMLIVNLWIIGWIARHIYNRRYLARIRSIHFARWTFMNDNRRVMFASSYDGSLESYNDDFINKGGFGLNFAFGVALGYPRTNWLIFGGAKDEQKFKYVLRRHQLPTEVWYNAYPGLTVYDLARNARVREGLKPKTMTNAQIRTWLADL
jgi:hypothetical protein